MKDVDMMDHLLREGQPAPAQLPSPEAEYQSVHMESQNKAGQEGSL